MDTVMKEFASQARRLNPNSATPLYYQLEEDLRRYIEGGRWQAHDKLPSEAQLREVYGVARSVVRQALAKLEQAGVIYRVKGKGAFIAERKIHAFLLQTVEGFYANIAEQGLSLKTQVLRKEFVPASPKIAGALEIEEGGEVLLLERLRFIRDEPVFLGISYVPVELGQAIKNHDFSSQSLNILLSQETGMEPTRGIREIESVTAGRHESELMGIPVGSPLFQLIAITYAQTGRPMECTQVWLRGDRLAFRVELGK